MKKYVADILLTTMLLAGCARAAEIAPPPTQEHQDGFLRGVSLSPKSFETGDFTDFLERVQQTQDALLWAGDWMELVEGKSPQTIAELAGQYEYLPIVEVGHYIQSSGELLRPLNAQNQELYYDSTLQYIKDYTPTYFGMGVEIDVFAEKNPQAFEEFVPFYNQLHDAIKTVSPDTQVFTVFQLESMKGLTFWEVGEAQPRWELMDRFKTDLAAFTTYPGLVYRDPAEMPADYYTEISRYTDKPIAFMEMGWHSAASPEGWESSEAEQAAFVRRFFELTSGLDVEMAVWSFLYDMDTFEPFNSMGLITQADEEKPAWGEWNR